MEWRDKYPKEIKPTYNELLNFLPEKIREIFLTFNSEVENEYKVYNNYQRYDKVAGWVYGYCRNYRCELLCVTIKNDCFYVLGRIVKDEESLQNVLKEVKKVYEAGYEDRYASLTAKKREDQIKRTKQRLDREKAEMIKLTEKLDLAIFNQFQWCKKVSRNSLLKLYRSDAKGIIDQELLDDVGYSFFARCKQAQDTRTCLQNGQLICHQCGAVLMPTSYTGIVFCSCGYGYTYREYRRSFHANNMPAGRATPIFDSFTMKWPGCKDSNDKMLLIDWLIHECHVSLMSGLEGRSVCVNLIEGTKQQISDLITKLAYGNNENNFME